MSHRNAIFSETTLPRIPAEISPWSGSRAGVGFGVMISGISIDSVQLSCSGRLSVGSQYLLEIPMPGRKALHAVCTVTECTHVLDRARLDTPLNEADYRELSARLNGVVPKMVTSRRTKLLFILFGILGLSLALIMDWP